MLFDSFFGLVSDFNVRSNYWPMQRNEKALGTRQSSPLSNKQFNASTVGLDLRHFSIVAREVGVMGAD